MRAPLSSHSDCQHHVEPFEQGTVGPRGCAADLLRSLTSAILATVEIVGEGLAQAASVARYKRASAVLS